MERLQNIPIAVAMLGSLLCLGPAPAAESGLETKRFIRGFGERGQRVV